MPEIRTSKWNCVFFLIPLSFLIITFSNAQTPQSTVIPQGNLEKFEFKESKIFPGTVRQVTVYIPKQIDPSKPACVYIQQDGFSPDRQLNRILDTLINKN